MSNDKESAERLIILGQRLVEAIEGDIEALKNGKPQQMRSLDPEVQKLLLLYSREAAAIDPARAKTLPGELKKKLIGVTGKFRQALDLQQRLLTRMRNASEGIVKAVADEVLRQRAPTVTYAPPQGRGGYRPANPSMIYNGVV